MKHHNSAALKKQLVII